MKSQLKAILFLAASMAANAQTQVPHDFQSGTPARAAEVNANFDTLETAIDANTAAVTANEARIRANENSVQNNALSISQLGGG